MVTNEQILGIQLMTVDCEVYPRKVWFCSQHNVAWLKDNFKYDKSYGDRDFTEPEATTDCRIYPVIRKSDKKYGVIACITDEFYDNYEVIAHESVHIADYIFDELGILGQPFNQGNEAYAYLVGFVAKHFGNFLEMILSLKQKHNNES